MLRRIADSLFWAARYLERAEWRARLVSVTSNILVVGPAPAGNAWFSPLAISGDQELFERHYKEADESSVLSFFVLDERNPSRSGAASTLRAPMRAPLRHRISSELWLELSTLYLDARTWSQARFETGDVFEFFSSLQERFYRIAGVVNGTLPRGLGYEDAFRNKVHAISVHPPHEELSIVATSVVERVPPRAGSPLRVPFAEFLAEDAARSAEHFEFLNPSQYVPFSERLRKFFWSARPAPTETVVECMLRVVRYVRDQFEYERNETHAHSSEESAVAEQASHAWIEVLLPGAGWTGFDPTLCGRTTDHHIRVAIGRDYGDVPPLRGVFRSAGANGDMRVALSIQRDDATGAALATTHAQLQSQQ